MRDERAKRPPILFAGREARGLDDPASMGHLDAPMIEDDHARLRLAIRSIVLLSSGISGVGLYACHATTTTGEAADASTVAPDEGGAPSTGGDAASDAPDDAARDDAAVAADASDDGRVPLCADGPKAPHPEIDGGAYLDAGDEGGCDHFYRYTSCSPAPIFGGPGCYFSRQDCARICGFATSAGCFVPSYNCSNLDDGNFILDPSSVVVDCTNCIGGRRPADMDAFAGSTRADVGSHFARAAHLEAVSIAAFRRLKLELTAHGAPAPLRRAAQRAAKDEARHTRATARLARRFGAAPSLGKARRGAVRPLEDVAAENAAEGCVRETFGAVVAAWQATHAEDADVRAEMSAIAADEARHAALAWAAARWLAATLDDAGRAGVEEARARALRDLEAELEVPVPDSLVRAAGLPTADEARELFVRTSRTLWNA